MGNKKGEGSGSNLPSLPEKFLKDIEELNWYNKLKRRGLTPEKILSCLIVRFSPRETRSPIADLRRR